MITNAAVDWLTLVSRKQNVGEHWYRMFQKYAMEVLSEELRRKRWNNGLYAGEAIGHLRWGYSDKLGYILIASSALAEHMYQRLEPARHKVTRVDLCMDIRLDKTCSIARNEYARLEKQKALGRPQIKLYQGPFGGDTLYVGSRQSTQMGRLYDKGVEQGIDEPGCFWRFEVEFKKPRAGQIVSQLAECLPDERANTIANTVWDWFSDRGIVGTERPIDGVGIETHVIQATTTKDKKLTWLHNQVRPSVIDLCKAGHLRHTLDALGIDASGLDQLKASVI